MYYNYDNWFSKYKMLAIFIKKHKQLHISNFSFISYEMKIKKWLFLAIWIFGVIILWYYFNKNITNNETEDISLDEVEDIVTEIVTETETEDISLDKVEDIVTEWESGFTWVIYWDWYIKITGDPLAWKNTEEGYFGVTTITIDSKNVWATTEWWWKNAPIESYWNYYQRWLTTWYSYQLSNEEAINNWFITDTEYRKTATADINIWERIWKSVCSWWAHIMSIWDWNSIINMFTSNWNDIKDFAEAFKIPFAGWRYYEDAKVYTGFGLLWPDLPQSTYNLICLFVDNNSATTTINHYAEALPIRCTY